MNEGLYRTITGIVTIAPVLFLAVAIWQAWDQSLHWSDLVVFAITYLPIGLGVTVGFHRLLTGTATRAARVGPGGPRYAHPPQSRG